MARTTGADKRLGWIRFRTQTAEDRELRQSMVPPAGHMLRLRDISETEFVIEVVPGTEAVASAASASRDMTDAELHEKAAKLGRPTKPGMRRADLIGVVGTGDVA